MKARLAIFLGGAALLGTGIGCGSTSPNGDCSGSGAAATISATEAPIFSPAAATIAAGQSVCWQNTSSLVHTVTANDGSSFNGSLGSAGTFTHTFAAAGAFPYHCTIHEGMVGTITVQ